MARRVFYTVRLPRRGDWDHLPATPVNFWDQSAVLIPWMNFVRGLAEVGREWWQFEWWFNDFERLADILLILCKPEHPLGDLKGELERMRDWLLEEGWREPSD